MQTKLTKLLGITYPIFQGAMAWVSEAVLAAAVSNAGGAGIIATGGREASWVENEIVKTKGLTDKPFGVNVMLMAPNREEVVEVICRRKPAFVTLGAGNPVPYFDIFHQAGIKAIPVVPSTMLAQRVEAAGADALIIEGMEAGGHIGTLTTMALLSNVIPEISIPVIAAGGIVDGRGLAAALVMGAAGVQMGSRFLLAEECAVHPNAKQKVIAARDTDSIVTGASRGHGVRGLKNQFTAHFLERELGGAPQDELDRLATGTSKLAAVDGDTENGLVQAGQSLNRLTTIQPAKEIIQSVISEARQILAGAAELSK